MDKFVTVTPATVRKNNKRPIGSMSTNEEDDNKKRPIESMSTNEEEENDTDYDLNEHDMAEFTQKYCTQADVQDFSDSSFEDNSANTFDMTQEENNELFKAPPQDGPVEAFHKDTELQVSITTNGMHQRIFKLGESFTSDIPVGRICRDNNVPGSAVYAIYTIGKFITKGFLTKRAVCAVRIRYYDTIIHKDERERIRQQHPNKLVTLAQSECIALRDLHHRTQAVPLSEEDLVWSVSGPRGNDYRIAYVHKTPRRGSFLPREEIGSKPKVLELFAGAGGMSTAFSNAGFDVRWMVECDPQACATLKVNHQKGSSRVYEETVEKFLKKSKAKRPGYPRPKEVHHIHASSPCQGFSKANRNGGRNDFKNNTLAFLFIDVIKYFQPETASFENVTGMLTKTDVYEENESSVEAEKRISYWDRLLDRIVSDTGYQVEGRVLRASDYGDPQNRHRLIVLVTKRGRLTPHFPRPSHGDGTQNQHVTVKDALEDLASVPPDTEGGNGLVLLPSKKFTDNHVQVSKEVRAESEKLKADEPSRTVRRTNGIEHYSLPRNITVREMARLQSFPDSYEFCGSATQKKSQIGNAVPVKLGTAIAKSIIDSYI